MHWKTDEGIWGEAHVGTGALVPNTTKPIFCFLAHIKSYVYTSLLSIMYVLRLVHTLIILLLKVFMIKI